MIQNKQILIIVFLICNGLRLQAQELITVSGGDAIGSGGTISFTIGQIFYSNALGEYGSVTEGVQQAFDIKLIEGIEDANGIHLYCNAYPNPTMGKLTLNIENYYQEKLSYKLFDTGGKLIEMRKITESITSISMNNVTPAMYFLIVTDGQKEIKSFQIIKH